MCLLAGRLSFKLCIAAVKISQHMVSLIYLHVCDLILFPVEALHLVFFQLLSGLHILVIVTLKANNTFAWSSYRAAHRHIISYSLASVCFYRFKIFLKLCQGMLLRLFHF